jgi:hypothetical protein
VSASLEWIHWDDISSLLHGDEKIMGVAGDAGIVYQRGTHIVGCVIRLCRGRVTWMNGFIPALEACLLRERGEILDSVPC